MAKNDLDYNPLHNELNINQMIIIIKKMNTSWLYQNQMRQSYDGETRNIIFTYKRKIKLVEE